jgi:hypothetical protein
MKTTIIGLFLLIMSAQLSFGQMGPYPPLNPTNRTFTAEEQEIINLSKDKWQWMADKKADTLKNFFHEKAMFIHLGGSWGKDQEINIIKGGFIWYKKADVHDLTVNIIDNTAILLNRITLLAVVGGREVINDFVVTEVYIKQSGTWKLGDLSFSHLPAPPAASPASNPNAH